LDRRELGEPGHADVLAWHRDLITLRRATPALVNGWPGGGREDVSRPVADGWGIDDGLEDDRGG
jgi:hypothetical protein